MRRYPSGLAVLTVRVDGRPLGATVGSLVSLSLEPPLVGVSLGVHAPLHEPVRSAGAFALSVLGRGQETIARRFGSGGLPPLVAWHELAVHDGVVGAPLLDEAAAWLECRVAGEQRAGDHTIFVGEVLVAEAGNVPAGLVYLDGTYRSV